MRLLFGSFNRHKHREISALLAPMRFECAADVPGLQEPEETGETLSENAVLKAQYYYRQTGWPCFSDDTGLEVADLGGLPGVRSSRFAGPGADAAANRKRLLSLLSRPSPARFRTVVAYFDGGEAELFEGVLEGTVILEERGAGGFGYDPIFVPQGFSRTLAELSLEEKNGISHRKRAMESFSGFIHARLASFPGP
jgi:XTP/dITP diphosphohydrolase